MKELDSRTQTVKPRVNSYATSASPNNDWGQPPASQYVFQIDGNRLIGNLIEGTYITLLTQPTLEDSRLSAEFAAWEAASDETLQKLEDSLGN